MRFRPERQDSASCERDVIPKPARRHHKVNHARCTNGPALYATVDLQKYNAVVIYCERFNAVFGVAREESL
jgi:hypothetical protein